MTDADAGDSTGPRNADWATRLIVVLIVLVVVAVGVSIGLSVLPGWWLDRVAAVADGSRLVGTFAGLTCGVVFTAIPLLLLRLVVRRGRPGGGSARGPGWRVRVLWLALAVAFAAPNLATLSIAVDTGLTLSGVAPGFGGATLVGAVLGAAAVIAFWELLADRRRTAHEVEHLRAAARADPSAAVDPSRAVDPSPPVDKSTPVDKSDAG